MKLLKYFIKSLTICLDAWVGNGQGKFKEGIPGLIGLSLIGGLFLAILYIIDNNFNYKNAKAITLAMLLTLGVVSAFFGVAHLIEIIFDL